MIKQSGCVRDVLIFMAGAAWMLSLILFAEYIGF